MTKTAYDESGQRICNECGATIHMEIGAFGEDVWADVSDPTDDAYVCPETGAYNGHYPEAQPDMLFDSSRKTASDAPWELYPDGFGAEIDDWMGYQARVDFEGGDSNEYEWTIWGAGISGQEVASGWSTGMDAAKREVERWIRSNGSDSFSATALRVRTFQDWKKAGYPVGQFLPEGEYDAIEATNQPGGGVFIESPDGHDFLLKPGEFEVIGRRKVADDRASDQPVDTDQAGTGESTVTDYDTKTDQAPMWSEDWDGEADTGSQIGSEVQSEYPGAEGSNVDPEPAYDGEDASFEAKQAGGMDSGSDVPCPQCGAPLRIDGNTLGFYCEKCGYDEDAGTTVQAHWQRVAAGLPERPVSFRTVSYKTADSILDTSNATLFMDAVQAYQEEGYSEGLYGPLREMARRGFNLAQDILYILSDRNGSLSEFWDAMRVLGESVGIEGGINAAGGRRTADASWDNTYNHSRTAGTDPTCEREGCNNEGFQMFRGEILCLPHVNAANPRNPLNCSCPVMCVECTTAGDASTIHCGDHPCMKSSKKAEAECCKECGNCDDVQNGTCEHCRGACAGDTCDVCGLMTEGTRKTASQMVSIVGPLSSGDQTFHVHKAGCADLSKYQHLGPDYFWTLDLDSQKDVVYAARGDFIEDDSQWEDWLTDIGFAPCVSLPRTASKRANQIDDSTRSFTLAPDTENWIGNFTDRAVNEMLEFWQSEEGQNLQPNLPGYADGTIKLIQDELARRSASKTASNEDAFDSPADAKQWAEFQLAYVWGSEWEALPSNLKPFVIQDLLDSDRTAPDIKADVFAGNLDSYARVLAAQFREWYESSKTAESLETEPAEPGTGEDAADVDDVPTPGQTVDDYPQPQGVDIEALKIFRARLAAEGDARMAVIRGQNRTLEEVQAYLPSNYQASQANDGTIKIWGTDSAGWTLDEYVIPRLASGNIFAEEVTELNESGTEWV